MSRPDWREQKTRKVSELIAELQKCNPDAIVSIWNADEKSWGHSIFIDECYGMTKVRLGSHTYDQDDREKRGFD